MTTVVARSGQVAPGNRPRCGRQSGDRLILFADSLSPISVALVGAALRAARARTDLEVVAVCDTAPFVAAPALLRALKSGAASVLEPLFDPATRRLRPPVMLGSLRWLAWRFAVPLVVPPHRDVNDSRFVDRLRKDLRPTMALSLASLQIFRSELLGLFDIAANYHNSALPAHRGLRATGWAFYHGEPRTGFTYHRMTERVDGGSILLSDSFVVPADASVSELERLKTRAAAERLPELLDLMLARAPGTPQIGTASYFGKDAYHAVTVVERPDALTFAELQRRLRAFQVLKVRLAGDWYEVSRLSPRKGPTHGTTTFCTADGVLVRATRFLSLPLPLYRVLQWLRAATPKR